MLSQINLHNVRYDAYGYLLNFSQWNEKVTELFAKEDNLALTAEHWEIIYFLRYFYEKYNISPAMRILVKELKKKYGEKKGNSVYLKKLFPKGPARQATRLAGLPKPARCI